MLYTGTTGKETGSTSEHSGGHLNVRLRWVSLPVGRCWTSSFIYAMENPRLLQEPGISVFRFLSDDLGVGYDEY